AGSPMPQTKTENTRRFSPSNRLQWRGSMSQFVQDLSLQKTQRQAHGESQPIRSPVPIIPPNSNSTMYLEKIAIMLKFMKLEPKKLFPLRFADLTVIYAGDCADYHVKIQKLMNKVYVTLTR
ncbi:hypothetical protein GIB67_024168, partial [Kingdonia uniflora]